LSETALPALVLTWEHYYAFYASSIKVESRHMLPFVL